MLMDEAQITISGGSGGAGMVSFGKASKSGPDGGNGGRGGDYYIVGSSNITLLNQFSAETNFTAGDGNPGKQNKKTGKDGSDKDLLLPVGTVLTETATVVSPGFTTSGEMFELKTVGERFLVASGGKGGKGNFEFRSPRNTTPKFAQPGLPGQKREFKVELRLIADFGLIGLPNAGKSSLLNELTNSKARVGSFAFTTLSPNLGNFKGRIIADIPGLIEGAHEGKGLGIKFLRHIERVKVIIHCLSVESIDLSGDYNLVRAEIGAYNPDILNKKEILLITKSDTVSKEHLKEIILKVKKLNKDIYPVSIHDYESIESLKKTLNSLIS